jgi:hypothetical protein
MALLQSLLRGPSSPAEPQFWEWFARNEAMLFDFEKDRERVFEELTRALQHVNPSLTFEFSSVDEDGTREFVISADGIRDAFPAVESLHACAPSLPRWRWVKFRPRREAMDLMVAGRKFSPADMRYVLFHDEEPGRVGILVFLDGYTEEDQQVFAQAGFLTLDFLLGEYDVETKLGAIGFESPESEHYAHSHPLSGLVAHFDSIFAPELN